MIEGNLLLCLLCNASGRKSECNIDSDIAWDVLLELADLQGVSAIIADAVENVGVQLPRKAKIELAGRVLMHEQQYQQHVEIMTQLAKLYAEAGFRMMILKGWGLSLDYPVPSHRPTGDLDIWLFGNQKEADKYLASKNISIDNGHHHHSVFYINDVMVENHYDFINIHVHRSNRNVETKLKELANEYSVETINGVDVYLPTANFNSVFLLSHTASHFASTGMSLRNLLDWGFFMKKHGAEIDWEWYVPYVKQRGMWPFFTILNSICVNRLGFDSTIFHNYLDESTVSERVLRDVITPEIDIKEDGSLMRSLWVKPTRWWHNRWKHRLCYSDSLFSSFFYGLWAKILKPSHFIQ